MAYEVHLADSVREKLRKMVKKDNMLLFMEKNFNLEKEEADFIKDRKSD